MEKIFATPDKVLVNVENEVGSVVITAVESGTTTVSLESDTPGAEERVERAVVECHGSGSRQTVIVRIPHSHGMKFIRRNGVTVRIDMPPGGDVDVKTASADIELNGSVGDLSVKTASGDVTADDAAGDVRVATASGDLSVETVGGDLRMQSASGDVQVVSVSGRAQVTSQSGDIELAAVGDGADIRSASGDIRLGRVSGDSSIVGVSGDTRVLSFAEGELRVRSVSGDIQIGIPHGTAFQVDAQSMSGAVRSEIPLGDTPDSGGGNPEVVISARSVSGDFLVERAVGALVP
ncbi:MAG TPA: DUF4097 family beta strand repeat-containing protein [Acidimicrobiales bacterium]|nr:DUF4097 family beta strand repeat-containing protein [Acidimicrobiales bacterium]